MKVQVHIDNTKLAAALKAAQRETNQGVKEGLRAGAQRHGLPRARALSPSTRIRAALHAGATTRTAYIEVRTRDVPFAGLLEYGGTRRDTLLPHAARALRTPFGPRAAVRGPRRYRAQRYMRRAVEQTRPEVEREAADAIAKTFEHAGLEVV